MEYGSILELVEVSIINSNNNTSHVTTDNNTTMVIPIPHINIQSSSAVVILVGIRDSGLYNYLIIFFVVEVGGGSVIIMWYHHTHQIVTAGNITT